MIDLTTGQPVTADIYFIVGEDEYREPYPDEMLLSDVNRVDIALPLRQSGILIAKADGYEVWMVGVNYNVKTSRRMDGPIEMQPVGGI